MSLTVFVSDDHAIVRDGLRLLLETQEDIKVIGDSPDGRETVRQVLRLKPDIVIIDIAMPELNGIEATRQLREAKCSSKIIILSMHSTQEHIYQALKAGANGYLLKESAGIELLRAVRSVCEGKRYLSDRISDQMVEAYIHEHTGSETKDILSKLSPREREILQLVVEGKSSAEIANILFISSKTVETYRSRFMQKLNIDDLPSLVKFAIQHGIISL